MRVLWLTPIQLPAAKGTASTSGGWLEGLRSALERYEPRVELVIASWGSVSHEPFVQGNAEYWSIRDTEKPGRVSDLLRRWRHEVIPEGAVEDCMGIIAASAPDVVHVHGSESFLGLALRGIQVPAVVSLQGMAAAIMAHWFAGLAVGDLARALADPAFLHGYGLYHDYRRYSARAACELQILESCDHFLGRTEWDRTVLRCFRPGAQYHHVGEVLDPAFRTASWDPESAGDGVIYCTSGSRPIKGLAALLDAVALLREITDQTLRVRIAGAVRSGPVWPLIRRRLDDRRLKGVVELLGTLGPSEVARELEAASLFVHPSHIDNSPNALCEAMLAGAPCVAAYVGGVPSLVRHEETGLLYHDRDPFMLAGAMDRLLRDRELATQLGRAARREALVRHDAESIAHAVVRVYEDVIAERSSDARTS